MARALNETGDWVLVYNNRVYVPTEYYHAADHARHVTMIRETAALVGLPNAIYVVNTGTRGPNGCMNADDPVHPCRKNGPRTNESWWSADHAVASEQLRQAEAGEARIIPPHHTPRE